MGFVKAEKSQLKLRMLLVGPAGSGKSMTALLVGKYIAEMEGCTMGALDTENRRLELYAGHANFEVDYDWNDSTGRADYTPENYVHKMNSLVQNQFGVGIVDSITHEWESCLDIANSNGKKWEKVTPRHNEFIKTIVNMPIHLICTARTANDMIYHTDEKGKLTNIEKVGLKTKQRDGLDYEFDIVGMMDMDNNLTIDKTRCSELRGKRFKNPGADLAKIILAWLKDGRTQMYFQDFVEYCTVQLENADRNRVMDLINVVNNGGNDQFRLALTHQEAGRLLHRLNGKLEGLTEPVQETVPVKPEPEESDTHGWDEESDDSFGSGQTDGDPPDDGLPANFLPEYTIARTSDSRGSHYVVMCAEKLTEENCAYIQAKQGYHPNAYGFYDLRIEKLMDGNYRHSWKRFNNSD